jgi:hypothetical protein
MAVNVQSSNDDNVQHEAPLQLAHILLPFLPQVITCLRHLAPRPSSRIIVPALPLRQQIVMTILDHCLPQISRRIMKVIRLGFAGVPLHRRPHQLFNRQCRTIIMDYHHRAQSNQRQLRAAGSRRRASLD